ncbi:MAG: hypothetical protein ACE37E_01270 [Hyphomicrobiales bacterium]
MKYAIVINGVVRIIRPNPATSYISVPSNTRVGYVDNGDGTFSPPSPPSASTDPNDYPLEPFQFEAMLEILGKVDAVDAAINAITDPTVRAVARAKRRSPPGGLYERSDPLFDALDDTVFPGLTEAERNAAIDTAWMQAKDIV